MLGQATKRAILGGSLILAAVVLLGASLLLPWYSMSLSGGSGPYGSETISFYANGQVGVSAGGYSAQGSYSTARLNNTGTLYGAVEALALGGLVTAGIAGSIGIAAGWRPNLRRGAAALGVVALVFALVGPLVLVGAQPGALKNDFTHGFGFAGPPSNASSPLNSFWGSSSASGVSFTWGAAVGWYLALVAGALALVGALVTLSARPSLGSAPAMAPYPVGPYSATPPAPPAGVGGLSSSEDAPPSGSFPSYRCTQCNLPIATVQEFQSHMREVHGNP